MKNSEQKTIQLSLDADVVDWLSRPGRCLEDRVNKILHMVMKLDDPSGVNDLAVFLEELGDWEDLYFAEQSLEDIRAGRSVTIPLEEVMKKYHLN